MLHQLFCHLSWSAHIPLSYTLSKWQKKQHLYHLLVHSNRKGQQDQLLYLGLILNELATNAFKHAFKDKGKLTISLYKKDQMIYMIVEDNGVGFEDKITDSLGITIVKTLVEKQLFGTLDAVSNGGTKITLCWKE